MDLIDVEVVYAHPHRHERVSLRVTQGSCVRDAIEASGILERHPDLNLGASNRVGIHARLVDLDSGLRSRDRIEIYRALKADPKAARKRKAV